MNPPAWSTTNRAGLAGLVGLVFALYAPILDNVLDNTDGWHFLLEAERLLSGRGSAWHDGGDYLVHQNVARLVPSLSWAARHAIFGTWIPGWHLPSLLLHAANAVLVSLLARRLGLGPLGALLAGGLVGLAPLHAHTVAWIGGTFDLFAGTFVLLSLLGLLSGRPWLGCSGLALALLSKESAFMAPLVLLLAMFTLQPQGSLRATATHAARRLWPYALVAAAVLGLRLAQVAALGGLEAAGLPARGVGVHSSALFVTGPLGLGYATLSAVLPPLAQGPWVSGLLGLAVLGGGLALRLRRPTRPLVVFTLGAATLLLLPVLLLIESHGPVTPESYVINPRYLYLSSLLLAPLLAGLLVGAETAEARRPVRVLAGTVLLVGAVGTAVAVEPQVHRGLLVRTVFDRLLEESPKPKSTVYVLTNVYDHASYGLLTSRWLGEHLNARIEVVQRGSWRRVVLNARVTLLADFVDPIPAPDGVDFAPAKLNAARGDRTYLLTYGGPGGAHRLTRVTLPTTGPAPGVPRLLPLPWTSRPAELVAQLVTTTPQGGAVFRINKDYVLRGYAHSPAAVAPVTGIDPTRVFGFDLVYRCERGRPPKGDLSVDSGYLELHWLSRDVPASAAFVMLPLTCDGQPKTARIPVWFDPVWQKTRELSGLGIHPFDGRSEVTVESLSLIPFAGDGAEP